MSRCDDVGASVNAGLAAEALVEWFKVHARSLPWREGYDPYRVLVSEFMLQQTQMGAAVPYFTRWMERRRKGDPRKRHR